MGHGTCKAAKNARHLIESKEKNRSSRVKVFSTHINLSHPAASWLATQTCANNIFNLFQNNNALYLFENDNKIELRMGHDSFFSIETIDKINKENIKEIKLKNDTTYVSLPLFLFWMMITKKIYLPIPHLVLQLVFLMNILKP